MALTILTCAGRKDESVSKCIIKQIINAYDENDIQSVKFLADREDGTPKQTIETNNNVNVLSFEKVAAKDTMIRGRNLFFLLIDCFIFIN